MSVLERLQDTEVRLAQSEAAREKLRVAIERICNFVGADFEEIFKSETLFDWHRVEIKEGKTKSKEPLPPISCVVDDMIEERKKKGDERE